MTAQGVGPFQLGELIGSGGAAEVYAAQGPTGSVAVKICRSREPRARQRFRREVAALRQLRHNSLVNIIDAGEDEEPPWYAMEDLGRVSLRDLFNTQLPAGSMDLASLVQAISLDKTQATVFSDSQTALPESVAIALTMQIGYAMEHAHSRGLIHRDLKPENVMLRDNGGPVVIDPGLVVDPEDDQRLTASGDALGTAAYMAPEQLDGRSIDERADVFALGQMLIEMLGGKPQASSLKGKPVRRLLDMPRIPKSLRKIIACSVEDDLKWRYASMAAFVADLRRYRNGEKVLARSKPWPLKLWTQMLAQPQLMGVLTSIILGMLIWGVFQFTQSVQQGRDWRVTIDVIDTFGTPGLISNDGLWYRSEDKIVSDNGALLKTSRAFPTQGDIQIKWENDSYLGNAMALTVYVGMRDNGSPGWVLSVYNDGFIIIERHGKPWWCAKVSPLSGPQELLLKLRTNGLTIQLQESNNLEMPFLVGVPAGSIGLRSPENVRTRLSQWRIRVPSLPERISVMEIARTLIAEAEIAERPVRNILHDQVKELIHVLTVNSSAGGPQYAALLGYCEVITHEQSINDISNDSDTGEMRSEREQALETIEKLSLDQQTILIYRFALEVEGSSDQLMRTLEQEADADLDAWAVALLPYTPLTLDGDWQVIWTYLLERLAPTNPHRLLFERRGLLQSEP